MQIELLELVGLYSAVKAMRLPFKGSKHDSDVENLRFCCDWEEHIGPKDLKLLQNLIKVGDDHAKVMRGVIAYFEISAPRYMWVELDTYTVGVIPLCSESTMHNEGRGLTGKELQRIKSEIKEDYVQKRIRAFSYQTLRRMYFQRKSHRLPEWQDVCKMIESLPLARELILVKEVKK